MKKILLFLLITSFTLSGLKAQDISYGLKAGVNFSKLCSDDDTYNEMSEGSAAFHFGALIEFPISDKFSIQPEFLFSQVGDKLSSATINDDEIINEDTHIKINYFSIPLIVKYYATDNIFFEAGPQMDFLRSADGRTYVSNHFETEINEEDVKDRLETTNYGFGMGAGYKATNGVFVNARYVIGLSDVTKNVFSTYKNNAFQFSVGFMF